MTLFALALTCATYLLLLSFIENQSVTNATRTKCIHTTIAVNIRLPVVKWIARVTFFFVDKPVIDTFAHTHTRKHTNRWNSRSNDCRIMCRSPQSVCFFFFFFFLFVSSAKFNFATGTWIDDDDVVKRRVLTLHLTVFHELMTECRTENHLAYKCVVKTTKTNLKVQRIILLNTSRRRRSKKWNEKKK